jgi:hypothetical protein
MHPAWSLLFYNPSFWDLLSKYDYINLSESCSEFHRSIPLDVVIKRIFRRRLCRKADLFRLLPLSVRDVSGLKSPVDFAHAFDLAVCRSGGFSMCMAIVRERGVGGGCQKRVWRSKINEQLMLIPQQQGAMYDAVVSFRRNVTRAVVWRFETTFEGIGRLDPFVYGMDVAVASCVVQERRQILDLIHCATGFFYKGIHRDVDSAMRAIKRGRDEGRACIYHHIVSAKVFIVGEIRFKVWVRAVQN